MSKNQPPIRPFRKDYLPFVSAAVIEAMRNLVRIKRVGRPAQTDPLLPLVGSGADVRDLADRRRGDIRQQLANIPRAVTRRARGMVGLPLVDEVIELWIGVLFSAR